MGPEGPLLVDRGDVTLHKEQRSVGQHNKDHTSSFAHVRAAAGCKTLLLILVDGWWKNVGECSALARQCCLGAKVATRV